MENLSPAQKTAVRKRRDPGLSSGLSGNCNFTFPACRRRVYSFDVVVMK